MVWYLYVLFCDQKTYYVGITNRLEGRIESHRAGKNISTKEFSDIKLVYKERYWNKQDAAKRERQLKRWTFAKKNALVSGNIALLKELSRP